MIVPFAPPQAVATLKGHYFDYVTVDAARRRVYAAHGGDDALLVVNADTGKVLGQVKVGPMAGVAVNAANGHVYTGDGAAQAVSEVDPVAMKEVRRVRVPGHVDAIAYDAAYHRIYADEDDGTRIFVIDTRTFRQVATIPLPGHKPEYLAIDPRTHVLYQNIATNSEIAVIDPHTLRVVRTISTPGIVNNHPLQFDANNARLLVGGTGVLSEYTTAGKLLASVSLPKRVDQCDFDPRSNQLACAANGGIALYAIPAHGKPVLQAFRTVAPHAHNVAFDDATGRMWVEWGSPQGDFIQGFSWKTP